MMHEWNATLTDFKFHFKPLLELFVLGLGIKNTGLGLGEVYIYLMEYTVEFICWKCHGV